MKAVTTLAALLAALLVPAAPPSAQTIQPLQPAPDGTVRYFIAQGEQSSGFRPGDVELARWALDAWAGAVAEGTLRFVPAAETEALVHVHWVAAGGRQYGEMRSLVVRGRRGAAVYIRPDTSALGPEIAKLAQTDPLLRESIVYLTCVHELGHALGLDHTSAYADIMYFFGYGGDIPGFFTRYRKQLTSRADIAKVSGLSADDVRRVRALYPVRLRADTTVRPIGSA